VVYDLEGRAEAAPRMFHEAAEPGNTVWCVRAIKRTIDFDVNGRDRLMRTALVRARRAAGGRAPAGWRAAGGAA
jgi:hypothetical protein